MLLGALTTEASCLWLAKTGLFGDALLAHETALASNSHRGLHKLLLAVTRGPVLQFHHHVIVCLEEKVVVCSKGRLLLLLLSRSCPTLTVLFEGTGEATGLFGDLTRNCDWSSVAHALLCQVVLH